MVDVRDNEGLTPLMRAAWNGHEDIVAALVAGGADIHAVDDRGITALQRAGAENEQSIVRLLRQGRMHRAQEILVLLANGNRAVGALALLNQRPGGREVILEKANAMLRVDQNGTFGTGTANAEFLRQAFGDLLQDLPAEAAQGKVAATSSPRTSGLMAQPMAFLVQVGLIILAVIAILALLLFFRLRKRS